LHEQHEYNNKEGHKKWPQKRFNNVQVQTLHADVFNVETGAKLSYFGNMESKKRLRCRVINVTKMNNGIYLYIN